MHLDYDCVVVAGSVHVLGQCAKWSFRHGILSLPVSPQNESIPQSIPRFTVGQYYNTYLIWIWVLLIPHTVVLHHTDGVAWLPTPHEHAYVCTKMSSQSLLDQCYTLYSSWPQDIQRQPWHGMAWWISVFQNFNFKYVGHGTQEHCILYEYKCQLLTIATNSCGFACWFFTWRMDLCVNFQQN